MNKVSYLKKSSSFLFGIFLFSLAPQAGIQMPVNGNSEKKIVKLRGARTKGPHVD